MDSEDILNIVTRGQCDIKGVTGDCGYVHFYREWRPSPMAKPPAPNVVTGDDEHDIEQPATQSGRVARREIS